MKNFLSHFPKTLCSILTLLLIALPVLAQDENANDMFVTGYNAPPTPDYNITIPEGFGAPAFDPKHSLRNDVPRPGNQNPYPSCLAWALGYGIMSTMVRTHQITVDDTSGALSTTELSPDFLYRSILQHQFSDPATPHFVDLRFLHVALKDDGVCLRSLMGDFRAQPTPEAIQNARAYRTDIHLKPVNPIERYTIKRNLQDGHPMFVGIFVDEAFKNKHARFSSVDGNPVWDHYTGVAKERHAMVLIGWDDDKEGPGKGAYEVLNSFGDEWGNDKGYLWIAYSFFEAKVKDLYECSPEISAEYGAATQQTMEAVANGTRRVYCLMAKGWTEKGRRGLDHIYFNVKRDDILQGKLLPGTIITLNNTVDELNPHPSQSVITPKGVSIDGKSVGQLRPREGFRFEEIKQLNTEHGATNYYWIGGRVVDKSKF